MPKYDFNKVVLHECSPINLLHIFRAPFLKNTSVWLLLSTVRYLSEEKENVHVSLIS